ncbi:unnamed protein product [Hyaloperonospora brassicae]|uniref:PH domain-containing protein n=1 Tax=Hyaloperonospora brassicae TaxID=162125 RepID=A0AAV0UBZ5_HYABA|nr:unnamed protein product [Hyaloperonospora brassicae]
MPSPLRPTRRTSPSPPQVTNQCTCAVERASDADCSDAGRSGRSSDATSAQSSTRSSHFPVTAAVALENERQSLSQLQRCRDSWPPSRALHNAEALRQTLVLDNVFCSCYDVDTVLSAVQRRDDCGRFSPVQKLLLEPQSIQQVFTYATSRCNVLSRAEEKEQLTQPQTQDERGQKTGTVDSYRRAFVATKIVLGFYRKAVAWYGEPKGEWPDNGVDTEVEADAEHESALRPASVEAIERALSLTRPRPGPVATSIDFRNSTSTRKMARVQRLRASMRFESSGSSVSDFSVNGDEDEDLLDDPSARGYVLRLEDLTVMAWKRIFGGLFQFLQPRENNDGEEGVGHYCRVDDGAEVDGILVANLCKIVKHFVIFPAVHRLICDEDEADEKEWLLACLAAHVYNPNIASLLHGLIHLSVRRGFDCFPIISCLVEQIVEQVPIRMSRSLSSVSSTSTVSSTPSASPRLSLRGSPATSSPSFFPSKTTPLSSALFTTNTASTAHVRISGSVEILSKILKDEFPNTFRYYTQTKVQLASFESVEPFERELFPTRTTPSDPAVHLILKYAVLASLTENSTVLARMAELGMAELRFLDAHCMNGASIPRVLVIDVLRHAIEFSMLSEQQELFVPSIHLVLDTVCALINYHQHLSTISEYAARDCFSDSDSDDGDAADEANFASFAHLIEQDCPGKLSKCDTWPARSALYTGLMPPAISSSSTPGKHDMNLRPLASTLLVMHVVDLLDVVVLMSNDRIDSRLARLDLAASLMDVFEKFPTASILHCRLVNLYLDLLNRSSTNERLNNPLLRSVFRSPGSILEYILHKLDANTSSHVYDAHLAIIGVKIAKICSSPMLQQEFICQFCNNVKGWNDFASSLIATHYQQMDALDDSLLVSQMVNSGARNGALRDNADTGFLLARPSSSASEYLSRELEPFRRLPMEKEGFGAAHNVARGNETVHPSDMFQSRSQSKFPKSIVDILQSDESTSFDVEEDDVCISGYAYQKCSKWAKVHLKFDKSTCQLMVRDVSAASSTLPSRRASGATPPSTTSLFQQFLMAQKQAWKSRPKTLVVCNARQWIAFRRNIKKRDHSAFGFQVDVFDSHREEDETLTFVTRSDASRMRWFEVMQAAVITTRTLRNSFCDTDEAANMMLVERVAKSCGGSYSVVPDVNQLRPVISTSFSLKSEVPEEMPFWGVYHGDLGIIKYASLFSQCLDVVSVDGKSIQAIGYSVIVEFDATFCKSENIASLDDSEPPLVNCACTDTYLISGNQIIGLTRTIADSEKLLQLFCDDD